MKRTKIVMICAAILASVSLVSLTACSPEKPSASSSASSTVTSETSASLGIYIYDTDNDGTPDKVVDRDGADLSHLYTLKEDGIYEDEALVLPIAQTESYTPTVESETAPTNETASSEATNETNTHTGGNTTAANTAAPVQYKAQPQAPAQQQQPPAQPQPTIHTPIYEEKYVVDQAAWTEEVPVYETKEIEICNYCKAEITGNAESHLYEHALNGIATGWHSEFRQIQTGTKQIYHEEVGHRENVLVCNGCTGTH